MKAVEGEKAKSAKEAKEAEEPTAVWRKRTSSGGVAKGTEDDGEEVVKSGRSTVVRGSGQVAAGVAEGGRAGEGSVNKKQDETIVSIRKNVLMNKAEHIIEM